MVRKGLVAVLLPLAMTASVHAAPAAPLIIAQQDATAVVDIAPPTPFDMGARFAIDTLEMTVVEAFTAPSPSAPGLTEVRAAVTVRNTGDVAIPFSEVAFFSGSVYPRLQVRDAAGDVHPADVVHPDQGSAPGSRLHVIEPGLAARWTIGFQVPTRSLGTLALEAVSSGRPVAAWDITGSSAVRSWEAPDDPLRRPGEAIAWTDDLTVTPLAVGSLVCGDPDSEPVAHLITLTMRVQSSSNDYAEWPGVRAPLVPAVAQWGDGTSARFTMDTFVGDEDTLWRHSAEWGYLTPGQTTERAFVFAAPRDSRLGRVTDLPSGVLLMTPAGERIWLDLGGVDATIGMSPSFCDLGFFGAPVPYAYSPAPAFDVGGPAAQPDREAQDLAASRLLTLARSAAGLYYDVNRDFDDATSTALEAFGPEIDFSARAADDPPDAAVGRVYWDALDDGSFYVLTQSASGRWFCATQTPGLAPATLAEGSDAAGVAGECVTIVTE